MNYVKRYRVYDPTNGRFIAEGNVSECAEKLGVTEKSFWEAADKFMKGHYKKYNIYDVTDEKGCEIRACDRDVIKKWDDFVTPIRKKYGIPVYKKEV